MKLEVCGGCNAKIGAKNLSHILDRLPVLARPDVVTGFEGKDDGAILDLGNNLGGVFTLDFFPTMVENPYDFGAIAATNALSDIYACGADPVVALNIVTFPEEEDPALLGEILRGGAQTVKAAGASLAGGHSIHDPKIKYGLAVFGTGPLDKLLKNNTAKAGDSLILTKPLGVSLLSSGYSVGQVSEEDFQGAVASMKTLNKEASEILRKFSPSALTDVTGFGLLGHLSEMLGNRLSASLLADQIPILPGAKEAAENFLFTAGGQRNRKAYGEKVNLSSLDFAMEEVLFDPQTSGGLLAALDPDRAEEALKELQSKGINAALIGILEEGKGFIEVL